MVLSKAFWLNIKYECRKLHLSFMPFYSMLFEWRLSKSIMKSLASLPGQIEKRQNKPTDTLDQNLICWSNGIRRFNWGDTTHFLDQQIAKQHLELWSRFFVVDDHWFDHLNMKKHTVFFWFSSSSSIPSILIRLISAFPIYLESF